MGSRNSVTRLVRRSADRQCVAAQRRHVRLEERAAKPPSLDGHRRLRRDAFPLQELLERRLGDVELLAGRLAGREQPLDRQARGAQQVGQGISPVTRHPREDLEGRTERGEPHGQRRQGVGVALRGAQR